MKLTVLGRYGKYPNKDGSTNSFLIESRKGAKLVLDMGSGSLRSLANVCAYSDVRAVVLSHHHGDHNADAYAFRNIAFEYLRSGVWDSPIPVYMPSEPKEDFLALNVPVFKVEACAAGKRVRVADFELEFFEMSHTIPTYGVRVCDGERTVAYTADTRPCAGLNKLVAGCDLVLADACLLQSEVTDASPHIGIYEMAAITKDVPRTVLTHLEYGKEEAALAEALRINSGAELATELHTIIL